MQKLGRRNRSFFRVVVMDARVKRQGAYLEKLGQYDPREKDVAKRFVVNLDRVKYWISVGAQPTEGLGVLLKASGMSFAPPLKPKAKKVKKIVPMKISA
ncbi:MAG: 30S ribosomal protein S16 [Planctomycetota bacterium]